MSILMLPSLFCECSFPSRSWSPLFWSISFLPFRDRFYFYFPPLLLRLNWLSFLYACKLPSVCVYLACICFIMICLVQFPANVLFTEHMATLFVLIVMSLLFLCKEKCMLSNWWWFCSIYLTKGAKYYYSW